MKKFFTFLFLFIFSFASAFAASGSSITTTSEAPVATVEKNTTSYVYYWGNGCPHCSTVNAYMKGVDAESKIDMEKREIWKNRDNAALFTKDAERLGLDTAKLGVPFMIVNTNGVESTLNGTDEILNHFKPLLGEPVPSKSKPFVFIILGLLVIAVPMFLIMGGKKKA